MQYESWTPIPTMAVLSAQQTNDLKYIEALPLDTVCAPAKLPAAPSQLPKNRSLVRLPTFGSVVDCTVPGGVTGIHPASAAMAPSTTVMIAIRRTAPLRRRAFALINIPPARGSLVRSTLRISASVEHRRRAESFWP